jgi:hypothetical protein
MDESFEVRWEGVLPGTPAQVWDAITVHGIGWIWDIEYEPRVGGAERGLSTDGGTVTAWEPPRRFQTRAERPDGWRNQLDYTLEPYGPGGERTYLRYVHQSVTDDYGVVVDGCARHTEFYFHSLGQYVGHFAGRDAKYVEITAPGSVDDVVARVLAHAGADVVMDYRTPAFLGLRADDALIRVFGREAWGGPVSLYLHLFDPAADAAAVEREWRAAVGAAEEVPA